MEPQARRTGVAVNSSWVRAHFWLRIRGRLTFWRYTRVREIVVRHHTMDGRWNSGRN